MTKKKTTTKTKKKSRTTRRRLDHCRRWRRARAPVPFRVVASDLPVMLDGGDHGPGRLSFQLLAADEEAEPGSLAGRERVIVTLSPVGMTGKKRRPGLVCVVVLESLEECIAPLMLASCAASVLHNGVRGSW